MSSTRIQRIQEVLAHRQPGLTVVLENVFDPHNIAAVMRTCDSVGILEIYVLNTIPILERFEKTYHFRSGRSADKWMNVHHFTDITFCVAALRKNYQKIYSTHLSSDAVDLYQMDFATETVAIVLGNEQHGVSAEMLAVCDGNFIIPQVGMVKSLNISVACAVTLYEAFRQKKMAGHYDVPQLSPMVNARLEQEWGMKR